MAEAAVSLVIDTLGQFLIQKTIQKFVFLKKVPEQVERLKTQLTDMQAFLKYADERQDDDPRIGNWVSKIRAAAYDSEDAIETFVLKIESLKLREGFITSMAYFPKRLLDVRKVGKDIESIQSNISDIDKSRGTFGIKNVGVGEGPSTRSKELKQLRLSTPFNGGKDFVALEEKIHSLLPQLLGDDKSRCVISIVGMPGVGKTTLAREIYNHAKVNSYFHYRAWAFISQKYDPKEVLEQIIRQLEKSHVLLQMLKDMQVGDLQRMLHNKLKDKPYLIVLDDIWEKEAWDNLAGAFPAEWNGSRLLFTSRYDNIAGQANALSVPYKMKTLSEDDSWKLFVRIAFCDSVSPGCPPDLVGIAKKIVDRCDGLPLAITVIGCLLRERRRLESEWRTVFDTLDTHWSSSRKGVMDILALSYNDLPPCLKPCFSMLAYFPEDYEIPTRRLFHLWIAEGFIQQKGAENLEDVAADHLDRLIDRNLVQVVKLRADETVKSCRVHDLLRDLAIKKAGEELFLHIKGERVRDTQKLDKCRHLAFHCGADGLNHVRHSTPRLRALLAFKLARNTTEVILDLKNLRLLRVLDLEGMHFRCLAEEVGKLSLLRYLSLRGTGITKLPVSLMHLQRLQTLDISTNNTVEVPNVISRLENLQHLYVVHIECCMPLKIENWRNLETLSNIHIKHLTHSDLTMLSCIRKLGVMVESNSNVDSLCKSLAKLGNLVSFRLVSSGTDRVLPSLAGLSNLVSVTKLKLKGQVRKLPDFPPNLNNLTLADMKLEHDPLPALEKLEGLSILKLKNVYSWAIMAVSEKRFQQLKYLSLLEVPNLKQIELGKHAMPKLRYLRMRGVTSLELLPKELQNRTSLRKVEIIKTSVRLDRRLDGEYSDNVVPSVTVEMDIEYTMAEVSEKPNSDSDCSEGQ